METTDFTFFSITLALIVMSYTT